MKQTRLEKGKIGPKIVGNVNHRGEEANTVYIVRAHVELNDPKIGFVCTENMLFGVHYGTGLIAGLGFVDESLDEAALLRCMLSCLSPKESILRANDLPGVWPVSGIFSRFRISSDLIGDMRPAISQLCCNHRVKLIVDPTKTSLPGIVFKTASAICQRMQESFCLSPSEIEDLPQQKPNVYRRLIAHAFCYRPNRGFVERICAPQEWEASLEAHPLPQTDEFWQADLAEEFELIARACWKLAHPSPSASKLYNDEPL